ncbi:hypothetical protein [Curtobacterium sp. MCBD17_030]|uniref:hypothetical protein n=1 Tax=Curtobacterium sp. MCBD17_030 TaxID=2175649 RepID=UPI000D8C7930|nr:hypothetical protein [Curtobacterium sp. MCBD17_030]PYY32343.1 hypothetical protein DEI89_12985 [Curtobacterium sp. MCBD17_030]
MKYALIAGYGAASGLVGVTTLDVTVGFTWSLAWPILVMLSAIASGVGVIVSMRGGRHTTEIIATMTLVILLSSYSVAIIVRTFNDGHVERLPVALLPIIISVAPYSRLLGVVQRGSAR